MALKDTHTAGSGMSAARLARDFASTSKNRAITERELRLQVIEVTSDARRTDEGTPNEILILSRKIEEYLTGAYGQLHEYRRLNKLLLAYREELTAARKPQ